MTLTLVVTDDAGNETMRVSGPRLPIDAICESGFATPSETLAVAAFARMFGFIRRGARYDPMLHAYSEGGAREFLK